MRVGIVGGGIMGRLLAFALVNAKYEVTLFDQSEKTSCSMVAAGLLTPVAELIKSDPIIFQLGMEAVEKYWPQTLAQLPREIYFRQNGSLVLAHARDYAELTQFMQIIAGKLSNDHYYQKLEQSKIEELEPEITKFQHGCYFPHEGQLDNQALLLALEEYLFAKNIGWLKNTFVRDIKPGEIILEDRVCVFDLVLDCRGLGATSFSGLRAVRGEMVWLHAPDVLLTHPIRFLHPRYSLYIVPRPEQVYLVGASEIESNDMTPISVRTLLELLTAACYVHSGFSEARVINTVTHCRPTLTDHLPRIKHMANMVAINGLYRHGFLIAPTLVNEVMRWIQHDISYVHYPELWEAYA